MKMFTLIFWRESFWSDKERSSGGGEYFGNVYKQGWIGLIKMHPGI